MSQENVEAVRRAYKAWNTDDLDAFLAELDPEVEVHPAIEPALEGGETTYRGLDGVRTAWDDYPAGAWERLTGSDSGDPRPRRVGSGPRSYRPHRPNDRH